MHYQCSTIKTSQLTQETTESDNKSNRQSESISMVTNNSFKRSGRVDNSKEKEYRIEKSGQDLLKRESLLPPPNPILMKNYCFDGINTALKIVFKALPEFFSQPKARTQRLKKNCRNDEESGVSRISTNNSSQEMQDPKSIIFPNQPKKENINMSPIPVANNRRENVMGIRGVEVYKKFDNQAQNTIPYSNQRYYASYFYDMRSISLGTNSLVKQNPITNEEFKVIANLKNNNENSKVEGDDPMLKQPSVQLLDDSTVETPTQSLNNILSQHQQPVEKNQQLVFESNFESGNLFASFKVTDREYDLVLQNDINSKGNTQWFFFSVSNAVKNQTATFNIVNLMKNSSLFSQGMLPVVFSQRECDENGIGWKRDGFNISYSKTNVLREGSFSRYYYKLSFSYTFKHSQDSVYFAHCFPYTLSDLQKFTAQIFSDPFRSSFVTQKMLCLTIAKNKCDILTITAPTALNQQQGSKVDQLQQQGNSFNSRNSFLRRPAELIEKKQVVFLTARQHPGETPSSYMIEGAIEFLTDPHNAEAAFLREHFIFKVIPMMNPDGVIHGNYRCNLQGVDLNRQWVNPSKEMHPTVFFAKNMIMKHMAEGKCRFLCDFHGHSKQMNSFFYGNPNEDDDVAQQIIPMECAELNPFIDFRSSTFRISADKERTLRQALGNSYNMSQKNCFVYTFEASFFGYQKGGKGGQKTHFSVDDLRGLGRDVLRGFKRAIELEIIKEISLFRNDNLISTERSKSQAEDHRRRLAEIIKKKEAQTQQVSTDSGSDSSPSEDELDKKELNSIQKKKPTKKILSLSPNIREGRQINKDNQLRKKQIILSREERIGSISPSFTFSFQNTRDRGTQTEQFFQSEDDIQLQNNNINNHLQHRMGSFDYRKRKISNASVLSGRASPISQTRPKTSNSQFSSTQPQFQFPKERSSACGKIYRRNNNNNGSQAGEVSIFQSYLNSRCESTQQDMELLADNNDLSIKQSNSLLNYSAPFKKIIQSPCFSQSDLDSKQQPEKYTEIQSANLCENPLNQTMQYFSSSRKRTEEQEKLKYQLTNKPNKDSYETWLQSVRMNRIIKTTRTHTPDTCSSGFRVSSYSYHQQARMDVVENLRKMFRNCSPQKMATDINNKPQMENQELMESFSENGKEKRHAVVQTNVTLIHLQVESTYNFQNVMLKSQGRFTESQKEKQEDTYAQEKIKKQDGNQDFKDSDQNFDDCQIQGQQIGSISPLSQNRLSKTTQLFGQNKCPPGVNNYFLRSPNPSYPSSSSSQPQSKSANKQTTLAVKSNQHHLLPFSPQKRLFSTSKRRKSNVMTEIIDSLQQTTNQQSSSENKANKTKNPLFSGTTSPAIPQRYPDRLSVSPSKGFNYDKDSPAFRRTSIIKVNQSKKAKVFWVSESSGRSDSNLS